MNILGDILVIDLGGIEKVIGVIGLLCVAGWIWETYFDRNKK